jgi:hypothetical protein
MVALPLSARLPVVVAPAVAVLVPARVRAPLAVLDPVAEPASASDPVVIA